MEVAQGKTCEAISGIHLQMGMHALRSGVRTHTVCWADGPHRSGERGIGPRCLQGARYIVGVGGNLLGEGPGEGLTKAV
jgi:hypothetical protein